MIKLTIINKDEYANYVLKDIKGREYELNINFMNMDSPKIGSILYIPESVLKENVSLNYGLIDKETIENEEEFIVVAFNDEKMYLQRYYG